MKELIEFTNSENFLGFLHLKSLNFDAENSNLTLNILVYYEDEFQYEWEIIATNVIDYDNFKSSFLMPYVNINEYQEHFLISKFSDDNLNLKLIGKPENKYEFLGKVHEFLELNAGFWITLNDLFWNVETMFEEKNIPEEWKEIISQENDVEHILLPKFLVNDFKTLCERENIKLEVHETSESQNTDLKLLFFGQEIVSPDSFNLKQPYIIAESFTANKKNYG